MYELGTLQKANTSTAALFFSEGMAAIKSSPLKEGLARPVWSAFMAMVPPVVTTAIFLIIITPCKLILAW